MVEIHKLRTIGITLFFYTQVCFAYKTCTGEEMDSKWLRQRRKSQNEFDYEEFCAIVTEYKAQVMFPISKC